MSKLDEKRVLYPRVSDIISKQNTDELKSVPIETLVNTCIRDKKVHSYCAAKIHNLWTPQIEPEYQSYVDAFVNWCNENVDDVFMSPTRLFDDVKHFTSDLDIFIKLKSGKRALVDIKTGTGQSKAWPLQLAAHSHLCDINGIEFDEAFVLHLSETPNRKVNAKMYFYDDIVSYWLIFCAAASCCNYFNSKEAKS